ncbi:MAG: DNA cytosine methyltransferase, partial [Erysipelotrichales bacterium]|nr:DNA cytosine methyltransferase [Erysipelotrichales bacterium]
TKFVILENVRNLADKTENWDVIKSELMKRDFYITEEPIIISPSNFALPQIRERVYILCIKKSIRNENILVNGYIHISDIGLENIHGKNKCKLGTAWKILEKSDVSDEYIITAEQELMISAWDELRIATGIKVIGFPLWIHCFGVGIDDTDKLKEKLFYDKMPKWKQNFVNNNRKFYLNNRAFIDEWIKKYDMLNRIKLYQKFEWNCGEDCTDIHETIIQIRQSGIRVKRPNYYPSLVAIVNTPIIWDKRKGHYRTIIPREAANLQNFDKRFKFIGTDNQAYQQLGNAINVRVVKILAAKLFGLAVEGWDQV